MTLEKELFAAVKAGDVEGILVLLEKGADINARDEHQSTPSIRAASQDRADVVKLLLDQGANAALKDDEQ